MDTISFKKIDFKNIKEVFEYVTQIFKCEIFSISLNNDYYDVKLEIQGMAYDN